MAVFGFIMAVANAAQLAIAGKQAIESEQGQKTIKAVKKKGGEVMASATVAAATGVTAAEKKARQAKRAVGDIASQARSVVGEAADAIKETVRSPKKTEEPTADSPPQEQAEQPSDSKKHPAEDWKTD